MRILVISNYYPPLEIGGWEQLTRDVGQRLAGRGHELFVLTSNYRQTAVTRPNPNVARVLHLESPDHVRYHPSYALAARRREEENRNQVQKIVAEFAPDVVFINGMWNLSSGVAQTAEQLLPERVVYYMASYWPTEEDAHTAFWMGNGRRPWLRPLRRLAGELVQKWLLPPVPPRNQLDFHLVLCVSAYLRDEIVARAGIPHRRTRIVHNGIELDQFQMRDLDDTAESLRLIYAGRLSPDKGVHTVIEGLAKLRENHPGLPVTLSLVGAGAAPYEARLRRLAQEAGVTDLIDFHGQVPREAMPAILSAHDALVFPSIWAEPLARMVQEAMATGLVVIGTTTGGTPEILTDDQNGLTFTAGDAGELASKIALLADDRARQRELARAARRTVEERFSLERMVDDVENALTEVIKQEAYASR